MSREVTLNRDGTHL